MHMTMTYCYYARFLSSATVMHERPQSNMNNCAQVQMFELDMI